MKVNVGEHCCVIDDAELGCNPFNVECPSKDIKFEVSCKHQNHNYLALKCEYGEECAYQKQVTSHDLQQYPDLFAEES